MGVRAGPRDTRAIPGYHPMKGHAMQPKNRTGLVVGACIAAVIGAVAAAGGITGIVADQWKRDGNGYFSANSHRFETRTRAIATDSIDVGGYVPTWLAGKVNIDVASEKPVFVGIAPKRVVDAYLAKVNHDEATKLDLDPFDVTYVHHAGTKAPGRPAERLFWSASATGKPLTWRLRSGKWSVVLMNPDGSPGVAASVAPGVEVPALLWAGIGLTLFGLTLLGTAGAMLVYRSRAQRREATAAVAWGA